MWRNNDELPINLATKLSEVTEESKNNPFEGTISLQDMTEYSQQEHSFFGAKDANQMNNGINVLMEVCNNDGAGSHNAIYRGKCLGSVVTSEQWATIHNGIFEDLYIGDYWTIADINYRIAAFDYYYNTGDSICTTHHVVIVPDTAMYTHCMNDTNSTTGAYVGSKMYKEGLNTAKTMINNAFGEDHILQHMQYLHNAVANGYAAGGSWYNSTVELMTEQNVYGCKIYGNCKNGTVIPTNYTIDKSQYPLFKYRPDIISNLGWFWLRDVASSEEFCLVSSSSLSLVYVASTEAGVQPSFSIC